MILVIGIVFLVNQCKCIISVAMAFTALDIVKVVIAVGWLMIIIVTHHVVDMGLVIIVMNIIAVNMAF